MNMTIVRLVSPKREREVFTISFKWTESNGPTHLGPTQSSKRKPTSLVSAVCSSAPTVELVHLGRRPNRRERGLHHHPGPSLIMPQLQPPKPHHTTTLLRNPTTIITIMTLISLSLLFLSGLLTFPSFSTSTTPTPQLHSLSSTNKNPQTKPDPFTDLIPAFQKWDTQVGCKSYKPKFQNQSLGSLQEVTRGCGDVEMKHVSVLVKGWTWIPDNLDNLYSCECGMTCLWTKSQVLADQPDAVFYETTTPPLTRRLGDPLRIYMDLEAGRRRSGREDIYVSYHAEDDVQATYAGALFHNNRNYHVSSWKDNDVLVYWSSSRCLPERNNLAKRLLRLLPHHSFGKCLNNVGGPDQVLSMYPECAKDSKAAPKWWDHLHCAMSHYKFVLAIENTKTESYVTEKLFYALDSGAVPIYFGAPNVWDFVPPHSMIDGSKFKSLEELASYVKALANDPVAYAEYHAWRRCGVLGNYGKTRAVSLDTLPCRLCEAVSRRGGRNARAL